MVNKKIVAIFTVLALVIVLGIVGFNIKKLNDEEYINVSNSNTVPKQNTIEKIIKNENTITGNEAQENIAEHKETDLQNETETESQAQNHDHKQEEVTTYEEQKQDENNKDKALRLTQEEWGKDDTVYYTIDNQQGNVYFITIRSKSTTASLAEYEVNILTNEVILK